ncbi:hypothetical protein SUGI_1091120 [Cryptomeria japonica]|nr:hypothetical protein SUGI_1091120 [Cryptomeria japonica]
MAIAQLKEAREHLSQSLKRRKELAKEINDHEYVETKIEDLFPTSSSNEVDEANNAIKELLEKNGLLQKEVRMLRREQEIQSARFCEILEQRNKMQNEIEGRNNEIVQHEDLTEQLSNANEEKLIERTEKKFDNKVLEHIAQQIAIKQVELTTILAKLENSFNNVTSFFAKLCDVTEFTKGIRDQLKKIDDDLKASAQQLHLDPSSSSTHHSNIRFLLDKQPELLREDARIRSTLLDIQNMILPNMDTMQKHITHSKTLIHDNIFSVAEHLPRSQFSPSHQWLPSDTISTESPQLPSSKLHFGTSMDRASTLTESMTMPSTVVDTVYQKITEPA